MKVLTPLPLTTTTPALTTVRRPDRFLAWSAYALAAGLVANTLLGPAFADIVEYPLSDTLRNQAIGLELVSLLLVAPLCAAAGALAGRGQAAGAVLALAPAGYTAYMFVQYVVGPGYVRYPPYLLFHLALFVLAGAVAGRAWASLAPAELPPIGNRVRRARANVLFVLAGFVVTRYLPALAGSLADQPLTGEFREAPASFWTILLMDLGIVVPTTVAVALALRRGSAVAVKAMYAVVGWFALVPPSVAAMALVMVAADDPYASPASLVLFSVAAVAFLAFADKVFRPVLADVMRRHR